MQWKGKDQQCYRVRERADDTLVEATLLQRNHVRDNDHGEILDPALAYTCYATKYIKYFSSA